MDDAKVKLTKEMHNLEMLKETLGKSSQLSSGMCNILSSFDERLMKLEQTILPVYQETGNLQRRQENIERTLENLDYVIKFYTVAKEVEHVIQSGPSNDLNQFLDNMEKVLNAIHYFEQNNPDSPEMITLQSLFDTGGDQVQSEFRNLLTHHSKPVPPIMILDIVGLDEEISQEEERSHLDQLPEKVLFGLKRMASWLSKNRNEDYVNVYATIRAATLAKSLQGLKEHQKSSSGGSTTLVHHPSPHLGGRRSAQRETPSRHSSKRIQQAFIKKASAAIMKYSPSMESSVIGHRFPTALLPEAKDEILEPEILGYVTSITALYKLMQSELQLMDGIIPEEQKPVVFGRVVQQALDSVIGEGEALTARVKKCVAKHDFQTALCLFPILRHLNNMKPDFQQLFEHCSQPLYSKVQSLMVTLQTTMNKALEEFIESIKNVPDTKLPKDGTVHELTSNVMILLEQLLDNLDTVGTVLSIYDTSGLAEGADPNRLALAQYVIRVLSALGLTLHTKSEAYSDQYLKAIFRLNNQHYILKSLQRTGLLEILSLYNPEIEETYNDQIREQKRIYSQSWSRVLHYVLEVDKPISQQWTSPSMTQLSNMKLKDRDRQNIKDKFTGFNREMEEIFRIQKGYAIPDVELRESLKRDNKDFILPNYQLFYNKYSNIPFTKNPEKYLKFTPLQVAGFIDQFFDAAA